MSEQTFKQNSTAGSTDPEESRPGAETHHGSHYRTPGQLKQAAQTTVQAIDPENMKNKVRLSIPVQEMPAQDPNQRRSNMHEVTYGYFEEQAWVEAQRCLQCPTAPCVKGCPVAIDIPGFIRKIVEKDYKGSLEVIQQTSLLPSICGRVCPQEAQCQLHCVVGKAKKDVFQAVSIGRLERFVADWDAGMRGLTDEETAQIENLSHTAHSVATTDSTGGGDAPVQTGASTLGDAPAQAGPSTSNDDTQAAVAAEEWPLPPSARETLQPQSSDNGTPSVKPDTGKKVAIIGSGPAGITAAADLRREGHGVTVFEAFHKPGGVMVYGIPEFRLPKRIVEAELATLERMGVEIRTNFLVGRTRTLTQLLEQDGYDAVFIGSGAGLPRFMHIEGENLVGVFSANEFLTRSNLMKAYDRDHADTPIWKPGRVAVLGGGNVAMDAARTAVRLGADEVNLIYRRSRTEMPARAEEVDHAEEEGVNLRLLKNPTRIVGDENDRVVGIELLNYQLGEPDQSGRRRPVPIEGTEHVLPVDTVIVSIGNDSNPLLTQSTPELETNKWGNILTDETGKTSMDRVYAGGDIVLGAATVILAMGEGRRAAAAINDMLTG